MLEQQKFLDKDSAATLAMIARDGSGKGDWGVYRKLKKNWEEVGASSKEKWATFEGEIKRLSEGDSTEKQRWGVSSWSNISVSEC
jgi:hypothetical protein